MLLEDVTEERETVVPGHHKAPTILSGWEDVTEERETVVPGHHKAPTILTGWDA